MTDEHLDPLSQDSAPHVESFIERHNIHPIVFALACLFIVFVLYQVVAGTITVILIGGTTITRDNVSAMRLLTMAGQVLFIFVPTLIFARLLSHRPTDVLPWRLPSTRETVFALLSLVWLQQIFQIYLFFQDRIPLPEVMERALEPIKRMMEEMFKGLVTAESLPELSFVLLVVAFVPAVVEELLFRGVIQSTMARIITPMRAAVVTGAVFGLFHFNPFALIPLMGLGIFFGILRVRSNTIILAMTAHFLNNAMAVMVSYMGIGEEKIITIGEGLDPSVPTVLTQLLLFSMLFWLSFSAYWRATAASSEHRQR